MPMGKSKRKTQQQKKKKRASGPSLASQADKYALYQEAVQDPPGDVELVERIFKSSYDRAPRDLREDFCGTAAMACSWVEHHPENRVWGIDLDPEPLAWGRQHNLAKLSEEQAKRIELIQGNVLDAEHGSVDVTVAFNFSYFIFKERAQLLNYFEKSRTRLRKEGMLLLDLYGGAESNRTLSETREHDDFDYVWDQDVFDPIGQNAVNYIHFEFSDGSRIEKAFTYDWRLWTIPELRDILHEAGYSSTDVYWEQTDHKTNEGNGVYYKAKTAEDDPAFVSYIAAHR
jgi:hypothetical protein